jgi:hypothetical protein
MRAFVALLALSFLSEPTASPDVAGIWNLEMVFSEDGTRSTGVCTFKQEDEKLTGSCHDISITGEISGQTVTWGFEAEQNGRKHTMTFTGALDKTGTTITGTCKVVPGQEGSFTARKQLSGR